MEIIEYCWKHLFVQGLFELNGKNDRKFPPNLTMFIRIRRKDEYCLTFDNQGDLKITKILTRFYSRLETIIHLPNTSSHFERQNRYISHIGNDMDSADNKEVHVKYLPKPFSTDCIDYPNNRFESQTDCKLEYMRRKETGNLWKELLLDSIPV